MKIPWIFIFILVLIVFLLPDPVQWRQAESPVILPPTTTILEEPLPLTSARAAPQTMSTVPSAPNSTAELTQTLGEGVVNTRDLYLRMGPGTGYQALRLMPKGLAVDIRGRSGNGQWLEVRLPDGTGGWAAAEYVDTLETVANLPVSEAAGGLPAADPPEASESEAGQLDIVVSISVGQAALSLHNFPANEAVVVTMRKTGKGGVWTAASGSAGADGAAELSFQIPDHLGGEGELTVTASTADGSFSRTASVEYFSGQ